METGFSLGSNVGGRLRFLSQAKTLLLMNPNVQFVSQSSVYETEAVDVKEEYRLMKFLNAVLIVESDLAPDEWLPLIKKIEAFLRRVRTEDRNAPRTIDIDILFAADKIVDDELLQIPHPRWTERRFVVEPLSEVRPDLVLPGSKDSVRKILEQMPASEDVRLFSDRW